MNECEGMILSRFFKCHQLHKTMKIIIGGLHRTSCRTFDFQVSQLKNPPGRISPGTAARPSWQDLPNPDHGQNHVIFEDFGVKITHDQDLGDPARRVLQRCNPLLAGSPQWRSCQEGFSAGSPANRMSCRMSHEVLR